MGGCGADQQFDLLYPMEKLCPREKIRYKGLNRETSDLREGQKQGQVICNSKKARIPQKGLTDILLGEF